MTKGVYYDEYYKKPSKTCHCTCMYIQYMDQHLLLCSRSMAIHRALYDTLMNISDNIECVGARGSGTGYSMPQDWHSLYLQGMWQDENEHPLP